MNRNEQNSARLVVEFSNYWCCSTGRGMGAALDSVVARDEVGLPIIPGRTLKGILRDAVERAIRVRLVGPSFSDMLFGTSGFEKLKDDPQAIEDTFAGRIQVSSAYVDQDVRSWMLSEGRADDNALSLRATLFKNISRTAINAKNGTAQNHSLRVAEAAVPLTMCADLTLLPGGDDAQEAKLSNEWIEGLSLACALIDGIGANRTRGMGRCSVNIEAR